MTYKIELSSDEVPKQWYNMLADSKEKLIPQLEEGIERVEWLSKETIAMNKDNIYPSLYHFLEKAINL